MLNFIFIFNDQLDWENYLEPIIDIVKFECKSQLNKKKQKILFTDGKIKASPLKLRSRIYHSQLYIKSNQ